MNKRNYPLSDLNVWLGQTNEPSILLPEKPKLDQVAAASALADSLNKSGKRAQIFCPRPLNMEFSQVAKVEKISNKIEGRSFVININYPLANIEKINWDDQEKERVSLVIEPKVEAPLINENLVSFEKSNGDVDSLIVIGFDSKREVEKTVSILGKKTLLEETRMVNINIKAGEFFGQIKLIDDEASSFSEVAAGLIEGLSLPIGAEAASSLLLGLQAATNSFSKFGVGADAFEAAAFCLRAGGKLKKMGDDNNLTDSGEDFQRPKIYRGSDK
jgi:nanoRNase/pAp phosphatase (c-di-AMP/oligoRNAs hydrolase)